MANTNKLGVPLLAADQAQKHVTHNDALLRYDQLVQQTVINRTTTAPPGSPSEGHAYIIAATATGEWAGRETQVAAYINSTWVYFTPRAGWVIYDEGAGHHVEFKNSAWSPLVTSGGATVGWQYYAQSGDPLPDLALTLADTYYDITNDDAGAFSTTDYAIAGTEGLWDPVTGELDFSSLDLGDTVDLRIDTSINTTSQNTTVDFIARYGIGQAFEGSLHFTPLYYKSTGDHNDITLQLTFPVTTLIRNDPAKLRVASDNTGTTVATTGWFMRVTKP